MGLQLPLGIKLKDDATLANFYPGENKQALDYIEQMVSEFKEPYLYLWGQPGVGISHLLQGACHTVHARGERALYLSFAQPELTPDALEGLEQLSLVCLDDLDEVVGKQAWESAILQLLNRVIDNNACLLVASNRYAKDLGFVLPDLRKKFSWGVSFQISHLSDEGKLEALRLRCSNRGLLLPIEVAKFLVKKTKNMSELFAALNKLEGEALITKRKLSVSFAKEILSS